MSIQGFNVSPEMAGAALVGLIVAVLLIIVLIKKRPKKRGKTYFRRKWRALQARCSDKATWATAIFEADDLLDEALKKKKFKGKGMGERLVSAQNMFSDNDAVWSAHKLRTKLDDKPSTTLNKTNVKKALLAFGQAMKDLGVI